MAAPRGVPWEFLVLAAVYFAAAKLGPMLAFVHASATAVWPQTGIALASMLLLGPRVWPAILLGAFLANVTTAGNLWTSLGIATGNTLEGVLGAWLVTRFANGSDAFERARDILSFGALAGLLATTVSATVAVWGTRHGAGPFVRETQNESLLLLQTFLVTLALTILPLAAVVRERARAEEGLARLAAIVESSDDAIIGKALDGTITSWNRGAERIYGYAATEMIGRSIAVLTAPDQSEEIAGILMRIKEGERVEHYETKRRRKDGSIIDISLTVSPIKDENDRIVGASAIGRDISQAKRAKEALQGALQDLRHLTDELARSNSELQRFAYV